MTPDMKAKLRLLLIKHEGYRQNLYQDSKGLNTIGIGRNLDDRGVLPTEIDLMFSNDSDHFYYWLSEHYPWFNLLSEARQIALVDLCFAGTHTFSGFIKMIEALRVGNFGRAAGEILDSDYAKQVGQRAHDLAEIIRSGNL